MWEGCPAHNGTIQAVHYPGAFIATTSWTERQSDAGFWWYRPSDSNARIAEMFRWRMLGPLLCPLARTPHLGETLYRYLFWTFSRFNDRGPLREEWELGCLVVDQFPLAVLAMTGNCVRVSGHGTDASWS